MTGWGGSDSGGVGGRQRRIQTNAAQGKTSHRAGGGASGGGGGGCHCPMRAAVQSVKRGQFRLAARYARMSVRVLSRRAVGLSPFPA